MGLLTNVKVKLVLFVSLLGILLIISTPLVNSVFVNLINPTETVPLSSSPAEVLMGPWPASYMGPAVIDDTLQPYNTTTFHVNVTGVTDLYTWQLNITWDPSILNVSSIIPGEFLALSDNQTSSEALGGVVINFTNNAEGYTGMAESILGDVLGITGSGRLVSIEFLVVGYNSTDLTISLTGTLPTTLMNSTVLPDGQPGIISFVKTDGYFRNKYAGDTDGDKDVDFDDFNAFLGSYLKTSAMPGYDLEADFDYDGDTDFDDFGMFLGNYLKTFA